MRIKFQSGTVEQAYGEFPIHLRNKLLNLRELIFDIAAQNVKIGDIEETLKWGQPSYVPKSKCGSPIRLGIEKKTKNQYGLYVHCSTTLIETYKHIYPDTFNYGGNRSILIKLHDRFDENALRHCINIALTYHLS
jgi:hypothetical protein